MSRPEGAADRGGPAGSAGQAQRADSVAEPAEVGKQAERRTGELLKDLARADTAKGGDVKSASKAATPIQPSPYAEALQSTGISRQTADDFHRALSIGLSQLYDAADALRHVAQSLCEGRTSPEGCVGDMNEIRSLIFAGAQSVIDATAVLLFAPEVER